MVDPASIAGDSNRTFGGYIPGNGAQPAYELVQRRPSAIPVLLAVPHAGRAYPEDLLADMRNADDACLRLEDRLADHVARAVARATGASLLVAHAPRAMIDLNRAPEDMDWEMVTSGAPQGRARMSAGRRARSGLGLVPRRLPGMGELWRRRMSGEELEARIALVHRPYHAALSNSLENLRDRWGTAMLLDLHSMPPLGPKTGRNASPDFVVGDRYGSSCTANLTLAALDQLSAAGRQATHNRPYAGGYVLDRHGAPARGVHAIQLEICRATYLDKDMREPGAGMDGVVEVVAAVVRRLAEELLGGIDSMSQAAE